MKKYTILFLSLAEVNLQIKSMEHFIEPEVTQVRPAATKAAPPAAIRQAFVKASLTQEALAKAEKNLAEATPDSSEHDRAQQEHNYALQKHIDALEEWRNAGSKKEQFRNNNQAIEKQKALGIAQERLADAQKAYTDYIETNKPSIVGDFLGYNPAKTPEGKRLEKMVIKASQDLVTAQRIADEALAKSDLQIPSKGVKPRATGGFVTT